ncbi:MAG: outer membrane protein assembly factor BamD [Burkholderiaceae bacterium]
MSISFAFSTRRVVSFVAPLVAALMLASCGVFNQIGKDPTSDWSAEKLYAEARSELNEGNWIKAREYYQKLESRYPFGRHAQQAQIETAYSFLKEGEAAQAIQACDRFLRQYPNHPFADYVLYIKALASFNEDEGLLTKLTRQDLSERDAKSARDSFDIFKELVSRYPESRYATEARMRMRQLVDAQARYEIHVANYYFTRKAYLAAIGRAQIVLRDFQSTPSARDALKILVESYKALGMKDLQADAQRVLDLNPPAKK